MNLVANDDIPGPEDENGLVNFLVSMAWLVGLLAGMLLGTAGLLGSIWLNIWLFQAILSLVR